METAVSTTEERHDKVAAMTGDQNVAKVQLDISRMKDLGVLVDIDIHGGNMFTARATWAELGIPLDDTRRKRLKRGSKDLIPAKYIGKLRSLEVRFRQSLERHSFVLQGFRPYRWVPYSAYQSWRDEWDKLQGELAELKSEIIFYYDDFVDAIADDFSKIAHEAWEAIEARRPVGSGEFALITDLGTFDGLDEFTDHVVSRAVAKMPSRECLLSDLYIDYKNAMVITGADVEADALAAEQARTQRKEEWSKQSKLWEQERTQKRLLEIEEDEAREMAELRLMEQRAKLKAMREAELEHARQQIAQTTSPFTEVIEQFRAQMFEDVQDIAKSIDKNGYVRGRVAQRAKGLLDIYRMLGSAAGDDELESALTELRSRLNQSPAGNGAGKYDTESITGALQDIATLTHEAAQNVAKRAGGHTRAGALEI